MTDSVMLREAVAHSGLKYKFIAETMGLTPYGLQKKIDGKTEFKGSEIAAISNILNLTRQEKEHIFFAKTSDCQSTKKGADAC